MTRRPFALIHFLSLCTSVPPSLPTQMPRPLIPLLALLLTATLLAAAYPRPARCKCQLRSWIVAAQGRHLFLQIDCPKPYNHLNGRVEFTEARLRSDYRLPSDPARRNRLAKLDRPGILRPPPFITDPKERLESFFTISPEEAICLQRDRLFYAQYELLGPNSNSALRAAANECGCGIPAAVTESAGLFGDFPGIERQPGPEVPPEHYPLYGLPEGPQPVPTPLKR